MSSSTVFSGVKKIFSLLEQRERKVWVAMIFLSLCVSFLEIATATLIMLFAQMLNDPSFGFKYLEKFGIQVESMSKMILFISVLVGFVFFVKNSVALVETFFQNFAIQKMNYRFKKKMLEHYAKMDYKFYLTKNSSEWYAVISSDIEIMFSSAMTAFGVLISEGSIFIFLTGLMIFMNPSLAGMLFIFGGLSYFLIKKYLLPLFYQWGKELQEFDRNLGQHLYQFFHAFKEMIILGKKDFFIESYVGNSKKKSNLTAVKTATTALPRLIMETLFVLLFVLTVSYLCFEHESPKEIMGMLGGYLYIGFRLMPGLNRMIAQLSLFKSSIPSIERIFEEYHREIPGSLIIEDSNRFEFEKELSFKKVNFSYSDKHKNTLHDINLSIRKGECIGIVGETGSGKSTLVDMVLGLLKPDSGEISIDHQYSVNSVQWHAMIAYVPQIMYLTDDTIEANIAFGENHANINHDKLNKAIDDAQLRPLINRLHEGVKTMVGERGVRLSGGEKQRIAIARALYRNAQVFIFDEATSALDNETEDRLMQVLRVLRADRTFIIVAHRLTTLNICDRIVVINSGKIDKIVSYQELGAMESN